MADRGQVDESPLMAGTNVWLVLAAILLLGAVIFGLTILYENGLVRSDAELAWEKTQSLPNAEALRLVHDSTSVRLSRDVCFGACPVYEVELRGTGTAQFTGREFVCDRTPTAIPIDQADIGRVVAGIVAVEKANGFTYPGPGPIDISYATITLQSPILSATVTFAPRQGSRTRLLDEVAARIDAIGGSANWIGEWHDNKRMCRQPDGSLREVPGYF